MLINWLEFRSLGAFTFDGVREIVCSVETLVANSYNIQILGLRKFQWDSS